MKEAKIPVRTITTNNGTEFAGHQEIAKRGNVLYIFQTSVQFMRKKSYQEHKRNYKATHPDDSMHTGKRRILKNIPIRK